MRFFVTKQHGLGEPVGVCEFVTESFEAAAGQLKISPERLRDCMRNQTVFHRRAAGNDRHTHFVILSPEEAAVIPR